jgi:serine/threonine protein kinase
MTIRKLTFRGGGSRHPAPLFYRRVGFLLFASLLGHASYGSDLSGAPNAETTLWESHRSVCSTIVIQAADLKISTGGTPHYPSRAGIVESLQNKYAEYTIELINGGGESNVYLLQFPNREPFVAKVPTSINDYAHHAYRNEYDRFHSLPVDKRARFVPVIDFDPSGPFLIMKHIQGTDLRSHLSDYGPDADPLFILDALKEVAEGLKVMHDEGIVHADFKPSNIIVDRTGKRLLGDFSFTTEFDGELPYLSPGTIAGTRQYLPSEERHGYDKIRVQRDLYALKIMTQALVLGEEPFRIDRHHLTKENAPIGQIKVLSESPYSLLDGVSPVLSAISFIEASSIDEYLWLIERAIDAHLSRNFDKFFIEAFGPVILSKKTAKEVAQLIFVSAELRDRLRKWWFWPQRLGLSESFYREVMAHYRKIPRP